MSHVLVGLYHDAHGGQDVPALIGHGYHRAAVPIALDLLPVGGSDRDHTGDTVALRDMTEILNHRAADNLQKLLTIIGYSLPVLDTQRPDLTNVNMNWNQPLGHFQRQDGYGRQRGRQAYAFPRYPP